MKRACMVQLSVSKRKTIQIYLDKGGLLLERNHRPRHPEFPRPSDLAIHGHDLLDLLLIELASRAF